MAKPVKKVKVTWSDDLSYDSEEERGNYKPLVHLAALLN